MQKKLLTAIIKSSIQDKKKASKLIDEFIALQGEMTTEYLEEFLSALLVYIHKKYSNLDKDILLPLIHSKLQDLTLPFNTQSLELIYEKIAATHILSTSLEFNKIDVATIASMRKGFYWAGVEYSEKTQNKLKDIIDGAFRGEYSRADLSAKLKEEFTGILSASNYYFQGLADHIINQSQNISRVNQALKYDVKHFQVLAIIDNKTSDTCRSMHGKIIEAQHLSNQIDNILAAKTISEKKQAAAWSSKPVYGKLPKNFGLPPYHFKCRTEVVAVWLSEEELDGKKMRFANKSKDDIISHIDRTGVQRKARKSLWDHPSESVKPEPKKVIGLLNNIQEIAPHSKDKRRTIALSGNSVMIFEADEIVTVIGLQNKKKAKEYFKRNAIIDKKEII